MVVVVNLKIKTKHGREVSVPAIANTGFESDNHEIIIPRSIALDLNLTRKLLLAEAKLEEYRGAGGKKFKAYILRHGFAKAWITTEDRETQPVDITLTVVYGERDVLLSDKAIEALNIIILKPGTGIWRFSDDPPEKSRESIKLS